MVAVMRNLVASKQKKKEEEEGEEEEEERKKTDEYGCRQWCKCQI